jgi:putative nucleotidyltransferase with HDIG domain
MNREQAWEIVRQYVTSETLRKHMLSVEVAMRAYAKKFGEDEDFWASVGLLHDFDWEIHPTLEEHPQKGAEILKKLGVSELMRETILSHANHTGVKRTTLCQKALYACDELTGLITACVYVRPSKSILDLEVSSIKKKFKDKAFARGVNREEVSEGAQELGIDLWQEHVPFVLSAMKESASVLGLQGNLTNDSNA